MFPNTSLLAVFGFSFIVGFGAVVSPGPVSTAIVTQAPKRGWLVGPLIATGHSVVELIIEILIAYGLTTTLTKPGIQISISLLGGILLLWMGISMVWGVFNGNVRLPRIELEVRPMKRWQMIGLGIVASITNPFWYAWWMTIAAGYLVEAKTMSMANVGAFYLGHITADYAWDTVLSTVVGSGRKWISDTIYRGLILICGTFLIYLSIVFLGEGLTKL